MYNKRKLLRSLRGLKYYVVGIPNRGCQTQSLRVTVTKITHSAYGVRVWRIWVLYCTAVLL